MIVGIGCDVVEVERIRTVLARRGDSFIQTVLNPSEQAVWQERKQLNEDRAVAYVATRWAAKEAFSKAIGTGIRGDTTLQSVSVCNNELGAPFLVFEGALKTRMEEEGITAHLSLSDTKTVCMAMVVCERKE